MDEQVVKFIQALRSSDVRVSLAESIDAFNAIDSLGIADRDAFRYSLRSTLIKDEKDLQVFEKLFPVFFGGDGMPLMEDLKASMTPGEAAKLAQALREFSDFLRKQLERLVQGRPLSQEELENLSKFVGLNQVDDMRYRDWMARRMEKALHYDEVRQALKELLEILAQLGMDGERLEQIGQALQENMKSLKEQLRQFAGKRIAKNLSTQKPDTGIDHLYQRDFHSLSDSEMEKLRKEVARLAAVLRTKIALRRRRSKDGMIDTKGTIRANLKNGNIPIELKYRKRALKPKLVVLCDISTSMRFCSELMLSLVFALQDQINKTHAFAFIDHLEYITPDFTHADAKEAVINVLERMPPGYYNTDLGYTLKNFYDGFLDTVDSHTTFIVVGDGRNNFNDPRSDIFRTIGKRSQRTIWLIPEPSSLWGTGDSDMPKYAQECDTILQVRNLAELATAVDHLLTHH